MRFHGMMRCCVLLSVGCLVTPVNADTSRERAALSLSGQDCSSYRQIIAAELAQVHGVMRVDLDSVPDHALVDVVSGVVTPNALIQAAARGVTPGARCQVATMKSCISASPSPARR